MQAWEAKNAREYRPTPELLGTWEGQVRASGGNLGIRLVFQEDGDVHVTLENQYPTLLDAVRFEDGLLMGEFVGECAAEFSVDHPHLIRLGLRPEGGRLSGFAASIFAGPAGDFALPQYVRLSRAE